MGVDHTERKLVKAMIDAIFAHDLWTLEADTNLGRVPILCPCPTASRFVNMASQLYSCKILDSIFHPRVLPQQLQQYSAAMQKAFSA
jgi:hypothetical protein